jgi:putative ABC transport system permease protein
VRCAAPPEWIAFGLLSAVAFAMAGLVGVRPVLARLALRNFGRRKARVVIVIGGLLVGTAIISSSLVVGDTLAYVFVGDVYARLDAIDEVVSDEFNGNLLSFPESRADGIAAGLAARGSPVDGVAPVLLKGMPVRNRMGNAGSQLVTVMGLNATREAGFGEIVSRDGRVVSTDDLGPLEVVANERAASNLNATPGQVLTLFYGTTNETIVYASLREIVRDAGKAAYERRPLLFMDLRAAQAAFNESGRINLVKVSNAGGVADGTALSAEVAFDLRIVLLQNDWDLRVEPVKADGVAQAVRYGREATELFLVMGAFSIIAGVLLIVNIFVMLAEERKSEMGIVRAVGFLRRDLLWAFTLEGTLYVGASAALGALAGLGLGYVMILFFERLVPHGEVQVTFHFEPASVLLAFLSGAALTWLTVLLASWRASRLNIVRAIRDLPEPAPSRGAGSTRAAAAAFLAGGAVLTAWGIGANTGHGLIPGPPLLGFGLAFVAAGRGRSRLGFSSAALFSLGWILAPFALLNERTDNVSVAFVITGVILVASAILLAVFNVAEVLRAVLPPGGAGPGRPVLRTAVAYPVEKRFRTGMTVAMFALILFMVTLISMVQAMQASSLDRFVAQQGGGYDVIAYTTTYGEIPDFREILWGNFSRESFRGGESGVAAASVMPAKVLEAGANRSFDYTLWGVDNFLVESNEYGFYDRLASIVDDNGTRRDLVSREDVWRSLAWNRSLAIVDRSASGPNQFVPDEDRLRVAPGDRIRVYDAAGRGANLTVVGVLEQALQFTSGVFVDESVVRDVFPEDQRYTAYFFQMAPGVDVRAFRAELERVFFPYGLQTIDIREEIGAAFDASQQVLTLMQAYLGIGLVVGIAGLAVVTLRAVVERRPQIGALRAIGFSRRMVLGVFLLEIALIAVLGVSIGVGLGIVFAWKVHAVYFADIVVFTVPWANLAGIVAAASLAAVASTAQPAIRASRIPPAEALRYIE